MFVKCAVDQAAGLGDVNQTAIGLTSTPSQATGSTAQALLTKPVVQPAQIQLLHLIDAVERVVTSGVD